MAGEDRKSLKAAKLEVERITARESLPNLDEAFYSSNGLTSAEVIYRQRFGLTNSQNFEASRSLAAILRSNIFTLFNGIVGGSFLLLLVLGQWKDALFGFTVVINVLIGIGQEYRSKRALDKLALLNAPMARVRRNGEIALIRITDVVADDLLELRTGDQVVADAVLINADGLEADESLLTGESEAIGKHIHDNLLSGSGIVSGKGSARVIRIGADTYASKITLEARRFSLVKSEIRNALGKIILWISIALLPIVAIVVWGQIQALGSWSDAVSGSTTIPVMVSSIASIVSMVPQGLVLITSIAFALAAMKLANKNVLVQELPAVESLARVDVICFDKTGTLTKGDAEFRLAEEIPSGFESSIRWQDVLAHFASDPDANATARSLVAEFPVETVLSARDAVAFSSVRKWSAFEFETRNGSETWVLGAPEMILTANLNSTAMRKAQDYAGQGHRVLAIAASKVAISDQANLPNDLVAVALILIDEAIRPDAVETLTYFKEQGVSIRVISGDNPSTVAAVARQAGIVEFGNSTAAVAIDGRDLPDDPAALAEVMEANYIFGRVTPEQKRAMVLALQSRGHVVAMTGDGVNDALALKKADLGIAMGSGSAATKAVARIILIDGKFASLPGVVAEGRKVIANIERVARLFLTKTTWAMMLAVVFGLMLWRYPYLPRQLSALDGFTIGLPSFALALLPNAQRYLPGFLGRTLKFTLPAGAVVGTAIIGLSLISPTDPASAESQTSISLVLALTGLWLIVTLARPFDRWRTAIVLACYLLFAIVFCVPPVAEFFGFTWLTSEQLITPLAISLLACAGIEWAHRFAKP